MNSSEVDLTYDGWNVATSVTTTIIGTRQTKLEQDNSYYNVAGIADTSSWLGSGSLSLSAGDVPRVPYQEPACPVATTQRVITGYTPSSINPDTVTEYEAYTYTGLGQSGERPEIHRHAMGRDELLVRPHFQFPVVWRVDQNSRSSRPRSPHRPSDEHPTTLPVT